MRQPAITAILLNYRQARRSLSCMKSLLDEGVDHVIVWDNSEDDGRSAAEIQRNIPDASRVRIEIGKTNLGFAAGMNRAVEMALHDDPKTWILPINNDATLRPGALSALREALRCSPHAKLAVPLIDHGGVVRSRFYYHRLSGLLFDKPKPGCFSYPSGCCFLLATERVQRPLFDERFFMYGEDCELGSRLSRPGEIIYLDRILVDHEGSVSSRIGSKFYEDRLVAAHLMMAKVLAKTRFQFFSYIGARVLTLTARAVIRSLRHRSAIPLLALWHGARIASAKPQDELQPQ
jgi:GT2 family glycosyltransferase